MNLEKQFIGSKHIVERKKVYFIFINLPEYCLRTILEVRSAKQTLKNVN